MEEFVKETKLKKKKTRFDFIFYAKPQFLRRV